MRVLAVAIVPLILLVTECYERPDPIIWNKVEDIPEDTVLAGIKHGNWSYELVSIEGDTSELIVDYEYFGSIDSIYKDSVQALIVDLYTPYDYDGPVLSTRDVDDAFFRDYVRNFARQFEEYDKENSGSDWGGMVWSLESSVAIDNSFGSFCEVEQEVWAYEGGAHGNGYYVVYQFDKSTGRKLKLSDFVRDIDELTRIAAPLFREQNGIEEGETLEDAGYEFGDEGFYLNDNFSFKGNTLDFFYNPYEVGPYSLPASQVEIPLDEIKHLFIRDI